MSIVPKLVTGNLEKGKRAIWKKENFFSALTKNLRKTREAGFFETPPRAEARAIWWLPSHPATQPLFSSHYLDVTSKRD